MHINKDTHLFCSFSINPGNNGCKYFNEQFKNDNINAIYKSFKVNSIENAIRSVRTLNIKGCGISMPFKQEVIKYIDIINDDVKDIGSCNTILNINGVLYGYNTDYIAIKKYLNDKDIRHITILGNGGYSKSLQYVCKEKKIKYTIITRENWHLMRDIKNDVVFNCTPVEYINKLIDKSNVFIDCIPTSETGIILAKYQAEKQYELYKKCI